MIVLGIVGCRIFEDEIVHVLANDPEIDRVYLVKNEENKGLLHKLEGAGFKPAVLPFYEIESALKRNNGFSVIVQLQGMGLHIDPSRLKSKTYTNVNLMSRLADGILLFYGQCGQAFSRLQKDFPYMRCPIKLLQDGSTGDAPDPLEDCIAAAFGGNALYKENLKKHRGTLFFTPMWAANWQTIFSVGEKLLKNFEFTSAHLKKLGYRKVVRVKTGLTYEPDFEKNTEEFARDFGFEVAEIEGSTEIARESYSLMRNMLLSRLKPEILRTQDQEAD